MLQIEKTLTKSRKASQHHLCFFPIDQSDEICEHRQTHSKFTVRLRTGDLVVA